MVASTDIVNYALAAIGSQTQVTNINPSDGSTESNLAGILYDPVRKGVLRATLWDFARKNLNLTQLKASTDTVTAPNLPCPQPWQYEYAYPADCLRLRKLEPLFNNTSTSSASAIIPSGSTLAPPWPWGRRIKFQLGNDIPYSNSVPPQPAGPVRVILTNVQNAVGVYTLDVTDPNLFDSNFVDAFAHVLASRMAMSLTGDKQLSAEMLKIAEQYLSVAAITDGDEGTEQQDTVPDWIRARGLTGSGWGLGSSEGLGSGGYWGAYEGFWYD